jgi:hypothetical protein
MGVNINPYLFAKKKKKKPKQYVYTGKGVMYRMEHSNKTFDYKPTWEHLTNLLI